MKFTYDANAIPFDADLGIGQVEFGEMGPYTELFPLAGQAGDTLVEVADPEPTTVVTPGAKENTGGDVPVKIENPLIDMLPTIYDIQDRQAQKNIELTREELKLAREIDRDRQLRSFGLGQIQTALAAYTKDVPKTKLALAKMEAETYRKAAELARRDLRPPQLPSSATYFQGPVAGSYASIMR
jgi:hypothetical protein